MPIYAYKCTNCGFEKYYLQKMSEHIEAYQNVVC